MATGSDDKAKRRLMLLMIFAPGIFFVVYWLAVQNGLNHNPPNKIKPPEKFYSIGQTAHEGSADYTMCKGNKVFSDQLALKNNTAVAEPNTVFLGLGLNTTQKNTKLEVRLLDQNGNVYRPLNISKSTIKTNFGFNPEVQELYLFKVRSGAGYYYFQIDNNSALTWRIKEGK